MRAAGIVRHMDKLGRVVLPAELRNSLDIESFCDIEISVDGDTVIVAKYVPGCVICGNKANTVTYQEKTVCHDCIVELQAETQLEPMATAVNV